MYNSTCMNITYKQCLYMCTFEYNIPSDVNVTVVLDCPSTLTLLNDEFPATPTITIVSKYPCTVPLEELLACVHDNEALVLLSDCGVLTLETGLGTGRETGRKMLRQCMTLFRKHPHNSFFAVHVDDRTYFLKNRKLNLKSRTFHILILEALF